MCFSRVYLFQFCDSKSGTLNIGCPSSGCPSDVLIVPVPELLMYFASSVSLTGGSSLGSQPTKGKLHWMPAAANMLRHGSTLGSGTGAVSLLKFSDNLISGRTHTSSPES